MTKWTKEQLEAIEKEGMPILVSAGAGSGKTAVLTERVLRKVKDGVPLNRLLILTFTKAAASEMKERIRKKLQSENLIEQANLVDACYITTFDSYALSVVKKYHYLLNIDENIGIVDSSLVDLQKEKILDQIFEILYIEENSEFERFISAFCTKDDSELKKDILNIHNKLDLKYDKMDYLSHYLEHAFSKEVIEQYINEYMQLLLEHISYLANQVDSIQKIDITYYDQIVEVLNPLYNSKAYSEIKENVLISLPRLPKDSELLKPIKEQITSTLKELTRLTRYETLEQIESSLLSTKIYIEPMISILTKLEVELKKWKNKNNAFEFHDIAKMAIEVVQKNPDIQQEMKQKWNEILLDEYQDTSDLQELFVQLIANNNIYMVGDMKQSIYRFRNANPSIFKTKYDNYREENGGIKIDLIQNFRSRKEPLEDINCIFNQLMQEEIGGANYQNEHQMVFGNQIYEIEKSNQNMHMRLLEYEQNKEYTKEEHEAFLVAYDIKEKIKNHYQVMDSKTQKLRDITYRDFVILMDRTSQFDLYRKIFEYEKIPLTVHKDETITSGIDIRLIYHILKLMQKIENHEIDTEFKYAFISVARSYLLEEKDESIFDTIANGNYEETAIWIKIKKLLERKNSDTNETLLEAIIQEFDFYQAFIKVGKVKEGIVRIEYLLSLAQNLSKMGYDCYDMMDFLKEVADKNYEIRFSQNLEAENSVNIMTIHKSKGLEYPVCYYTGLYSKFNKSDIKERMTYDSKVGFMIPTTENGIQNTILKDLMRNDYQKQEISEKVRLFYVALTRCKEQMILVLPRIKESTSLKQIDSYQALHFQSFEDMITAIHGKLLKHVEEVQLMNLTKAYKEQPSKEFEKCKEPDVLQVNPVCIPQEEIQEITFSKKTNESLKEEQYRNIIFGKQVHHILEHFDFIHPNYNNISPFVKKKIEKFLESDIWKQNPIHIYQEYEFYDIEDEKQMHGIIDLIVEYENEIYLVDYKLKQINNAEYKRQLLGYQNYIKKITSKEVTTYLYSFLDETLEKII